MTSTAAEIIAQGLARAGCRYAFGMPGGEVLALLDALARAGIDFTLCKHENAAGFMAEGSWQATGAPGILLTTIGPGLANGVNSVANALQEQVPLIVLSGCIGPAQASRFTHQVIDQGALMAPVTKATFQVADGNAGTVIEKAVSIARSDPPGPVHVDLPVSVATAPAVAAQVPSGPVPERFQAVSPAAVAAAADRLRTARTPLILAGIGAVLHGAGPGILALSEAQDIPVLTTYKAKGVMPEGHPNSLGGHGLSPVSDSVVLPLLRQSDCILCLGYDPIEMRSDWIDPWDADTAMEFVHAPAEHGMHGSRFRHVCHVGAAARHLHAALADAPAGRWPGGQWRDARTKLAGLFAPRADWGPHAVFSVLDRDLPRSAVVTADSGAHRILLTQMFHADRPGHLLQSAAFCTMGVAVPLAMGHKLAAPDVPVVAVVGDAGLDMVAGDLATLRDMRLPLTIVVLVDDALTLIDRKQTAMQLPERGVVFGRTDFPTLAAAYGGHGETVTDAASLRRALAEAESRETFTILACPIDKSGYDGAF